MAASLSLALFCTVIVMSLAPSALSTYNYRRGNNYGRGRWSPPAYSPRTWNNPAWTIGPCEKMDMTLTWNIPPWIQRPTKMITCQCGQDTRNKLNILIKDMFKCKIYQQRKMHCEPCIDVDMHAICQVYRHCLECDTTNERCLRCPGTRYGKMCDNECKCHNGGTCNEAGKCTCPSEYHGTNCENPIARTCPKLTAPQNGYVDNPSDRYISGATLRFSCQQDFVLIGSTSRVCQPDESWSGVQPACVRACSDPGPLINGQIRVIGGPQKDSRFSVGTMIEFSCDESWLLIGSKRAACTENGVWNQDTPVCFKVTTCSEPENLPNGIIEIFQQEGVSSSGKVFRSGIIQSDAPRKTIPRYPTALSSGTSQHGTPLAGALLPRGQYHVGAQAVFACESKYYKLQGSRVRTCISNGEWSGRPSTCIPECGRSNGPRTPFITHGTPSLVGQWPFVVGVSRLIKDGNWFLLCGGSLIDERWLLTAAHCVTFQLQTTLVPLDEFRFYLGKYYRNDSMDDKEVQMRRAESIHIHPDYDPFSMDSDIALVRLSQPVTLSSRIQPVCLPPPESTASERRLREGNHGLIIGWGQTENGTWSPVLRHTSVPVIPNAKCEDEYRESGMRLVITNNMYCAGFSAGKHDSCSGDSGGPMVFSGDSSATWWVLEGITSWGSPNGCGLEKQYGGYVRVHKFVEWIHHFV